MKFIVDKIHEYFQFEGISFVEIVKHKIDFRNEIYIIRLRICHFHSKIRFSKHRLRILFFFKNVSVMLLSCH